MGGGAPRRWTSLLLAHLSGGRVAGRRRCRHGWAVELTVAWWRRTPPAGRARPPRRAGSLVDTTRRRIDEVVSALAFSGLRSASEMSLALAPVDSLGQAVGVRARPGRDLVRRAAWPVHRLARDGTSARSVASPPWPRHVTSIRRPSCPAQGALHVTFDRAPVKGSRGDSDVSMRPPEFTGAGPRAPRRTAGVRRWSSRSPTCPSWTRWTAGSPYCGWRLGCRRRAGDRRRVPHRSTGGLSCMPSAAARASRAVGRHRAAVAPRC